MSLIEAGDKGGIVSRGQFALSPETIAFLHSPDGLRQGKLRSSDSPELTLLFSPPEQAARNVDRLQGDQATSLFRSLTPKEMATALSAIGDLFTNPANLAKIKEYEKKQKESTALARPFVEEFKAVYGREIEEEELRDPKRREALLKDHPKLQARWNEFAQHLIDIRPVTTAHRSTIQLFQEQAQKILDDICGRSNLPPITFEFTREHKTFDGQATLSGSYHSSKIAIPEQRLAEEPMNKSDVVEIFAHETKHHEQQTWMMAKALEDIASDKPLADQIKAIQKRWKEDFNLEPTGDFIRDVHKRKAGHKLTEEERKRAESYERSHVEAKASGEKEEQILLLMAIEKTVKDKSAWDAFKIIDEFEKKLEGIPKDTLTDLIQQYKKNKGQEKAPETWDEKDAKETLDFWTGIWLPQLRSEVRTHYRTSVTENEANKVGLDAAEAAK
jgi:hypothetical protein